MGNVFLKCIFSWTRHIPVIAALGRWRQQSQELKASHDYMEASLDYMRPFLKKQTTALWYIFKFELEEMAAAF